MKDITKRQAEALAAFMRAQRRDGRPPTLRMLANDLRITAPSAYQLMLYLERAGWVKRVPGRGGFVLATARTS